MRAAAISLALALSTAPAAARVGDTSDDDNLEARAVMPMMLWASGRLCGHDVPESLKDTALLMITGMYGAKDVVERSIGIGKAVADKFFALSASDQRKYCIGARMKIREFEDASE